MVMCEGGATLHGALLEAGLYDEAALYLAPLFLGDEGVPLLRNFAVPAVSAAPWLTQLEVTRLGPDVLVSGLLRRGAFAPSSPLAAAPERESAAASLEDPGAPRPKEDGDVHRPG